MLKEGQTLSHYRLVEKIGQGGMGEVWRATDGRLDRDVALKVLPDLLTGDQIRLDRFTREAKLLASLNHSGIATIHDVDEHDGVRFIVMELVGGDDLSQTLERGALPVAEALDVALQIARAVEAAHGQGVVHRDLKPANVKRTTDSQVKVLDFGLAKAMEPDPASGEPSVSMSPTMTSAGTIAGVILGTAAYMSPEQARGRPIDKRTDVWSFGVLLYELLTGDNPFHGDTVADSVGAIMHRDPDLEALPAGTPVAIGRLLRRCLTRERSQRLHDIADARIELEEAIANPEAEPAASGTPQATPAPSKTPWIALAVLVPLAALAAWWAGSRETPPNPQPMRQFELVPDLEIDAVELSPDGSRLAYRVDAELFIRTLDSLDSRKLADVDVGGPINIFWAPNSQSLGFSTGKGEIKRIDLDGGAPTVLLDLSVPPMLIQWADDGFIYFVEFQSDIKRVPESGGAAEPHLERHEEMLDYHGLTVLPAGKGVVTIPHLTEGDNRKIMLDRPGEETVVLFESDSTINRCRYAPTGHVLFEREDDPAGLWALPFSIERLETTGPPFMVVPELDEASFSAAGDLAYSRAALQSSEQEQRIAWFDRNGEIVDRLDIPVYEASRPVISPDGTRLALIAKGAGRVTTDKPNLWVIDLERGTSTQLTEGGVRQAVPVWSPDGVRIAFGEDAPGGKGKIAAVRTDGSGTPERLTETDTLFFFTLSSDWSYAATMVGAVDAETGFDIAIEALGEPPSPVAAVQGPNHDIAPAIHPDGQWIAYMAGDIANMDTYVRPFPEGEGQWKVSVGSGGFPLWSPDGTRLYYVTGAQDGEQGRLMEVTFDGSGPTPKLGTPIELYTMKNTQGAVTPDAQGRFLYPVDEVPEDDADKPDTTGIVLIQNWLSRFGS